MGVIRIGVTGASGFIGKNISKYFEQKGMEVVHLNLRKEYAKEHLNGLSALVHLAGKAHDLKGKAQLEEYIAVNTTLTANLYTDFLSSDVPVFCYLSSVKAVVDHPSDIVTETMTASPATSYGISKLKAEEFIISQKPVGGKRTYILRPCMIHGPENKGNLNLLYQFVKRGVPYPLAAFHNKRSFLAVENLCFVIEQLIKRTDVSSGVYHVADSQPISTNDLIQLIGQTLGRKPIMWSVPKFFVRVISRIGDVLKLPINSHVLNKLTEDYIVSNEKIEKALGTPLPVEVEAGLRKTLSSF